MVVSMLLSFVPMQVAAITVSVSTWQDLRDAVNDPTVTEIIIENDIILPTGAPGFAIIIPAGRDIIITSAPGELYTLTREIGGQRHFLVDGTLRLVNVELSGNYPAILTNHGGVEVRAGGSLYMEAGSAIRNNRWIAAGHGGGVTLMGAGAAFTMNGGEISENSSFNINPITSAITGIVGGVFVGDGTTFTMNGGVIRNNWGRLGGGVAVGTATGSVVNTSMVMNGGEIYDNRSTLGGGVNVERGTFTMVDGEIHGNIASGLDNNGINLNNNRGGGGVFIQNNGIFNMQGGTIHTNHSYNHGGGVMSVTAANQFNMTGGTIRDNTADDAGGGVRMANGLFTMGFGTLEDGTITYGTITGNTATNDGGGIWLGTGTATANARLNITGGEISNNTASYGDGGGIFTSAFAYIDPLPANAYPNIIAANPLPVTFFGNSAGGGKFAPPSNYGIRPFGQWLNNYDINYRGTEQVALVTFILNGGNVGGSTASISYVVPLDGPLNVPAPVRTGYDFLGWHRYGDYPPELFSAEDIVDMLPIDGSMTFIAQWERIMHTVTFAPGAHGTLVGGTPNVTIQVAHGDTVAAAQIPGVNAYAGWWHYGWADANPLYFEVTGPVTFTATYTQVMYDVIFDLNGGNVGGDTADITYWFPYGVAIGVLGDGIVPVPSRPGYTFSGWRYTGQAYGTPNLTNEDVAAHIVTGDITFTAQWTSNVTDDGDWESPTEPTRPTQPPAESGVHHAYLIGFEDGTIRPEATVTRAQAATIVFRLMSDADRAEFWRQDNPYSDVELTDWYNNAISTTSNFGIFHGTPNGVFQPYRAITRAELASVLARLQDVSCNEAPVFIDTHGHWAQEAINAAALHGWVQGFAGPDGTFLPDQPITRAEAAAMINRAFNRLPENQQDLLPNMRIWPDNANPNAWYYLYIQEATNSHRYIRKAGGVHETWVQIILPERPWHLLERPESRPEDIFR